MSRAAWMAVWAGWAMAFAGVGADAQQAVSSTPPAKAQSQKPVPKHQGAKQHAKADAKTKAPVKPAPAVAAVATPKPASQPAAQPQTAVAEMSEPKPGAHFGSLRADKVFMRSGPSGDYPIQWVYVRRGLPVEILASFDVWRKVRDVEGTEGWVHQQMLTGRRSVLITGMTRDLRQDPQPTAQIVAQLEPGVIATISHCDPNWCELKTGGYRGWLKRDELWGVEPGETIE